MVNLDLFLSEVSELSCAVEHFDCFSFMFIVRNDSVVSDDSRWSEFLEDSVVLVRREVVDVAVHEFLKEINGSCDRFQYGSSGRNHESNLIPKDLRAEGLMKLFGNVPECCDDSNKGDAKELKCNGQRTEEVLQVSLFNEALSVLLVSLMESQV
jgi:hypothetical protein